MDIGVISQLVTTIGFPIAACVALGYYVKHNNDAHREDMNKMIDDNRKQISEIMDSNNNEVSSITEAINNNTIALKVLCTKMGVELDEGI